jgi:CRISPR/Cas system-associated protein Csm6
MPLFVLSPCGTSLLTNKSTDEERKLVGKYANCTNREEVSAEHMSVLAALIDRVTETVSTADIEQAARISAELNAITKIYNGQITNNGDYHCLICTDTWLGETTASLVAKWLRDRGLTVEVKRQVDLQTRDIDAFQSALSDLVQWAEETIPGYSNPS